MFKMLSLWEKKRKIFYNKYFTCEIKKVNYNFKWLDWLLIIVLRTNKN